MKWVDRNWRARIAQAETYIGMGEYQLQRLYRYLMAGAALKILFWNGMPWWAVPLLAPPVLGSSWLLGWAMNRFGWVKQAQEVQVLENITPLEKWRYWMAKRTADALGFPLNDIPESLPPEMYDVMTSGKHS